MSDVTTRRYVVRGRVQGVWFRDTTRRAAEELGLRGWVRNRSDGSVECLARGPAADLDRLRAALERGSPASRVAEVSEETVMRDEELDGFEIRR